MVMHMFPCSLSSRLSVIPLALAGVGAEDVRRVAGWTQLGGYNACVWLLTRGVGVQSKDRALAGGGEAPLRGFTDEINTKRSASMNIIQAMR